MGKRRIEIKKIEDKAKQKVTFWKRRKGLFKMAMELGQKYDAEVAVITLSNAGNIFAFGHPSVDSIVQRYTETKKAESSAAKRDNDGQQEMQNLPEDGLDETMESPDDEQEMSDHVMELNKAKLSSETRNGGQEEVHDLAENDDMSDIEESLDDDDVDQEMSDREMEVKKAKSSSEKRTEDRQELDDLTEDEEEIELEDSLDDDDDEDDDQKNMMSDQMDLSLKLSLPLPPRTSAEKEDMSPGMMIKQKSESGKGLAISLPAGGSQKNATNQEIQDSGNVVKTQGNSIANSIMMPSLIRDVPPVEDLELHELQEIISQMEEMKKKVIHQVNQIMQTSADSSGDCNKDTRT